MITQKEIARQLNINQATVSLALRGSNKISPSVREAVMTFASKKGYSHNLAGQLLRKKRTNIIGIVFPRLSNMFYVQLFEHLQKSLTETGYILFIIPAETHNELEQAASKFLSVNAAAVVARTWHHKHFTHLRKKGIATVFYEGCILDDLESSQIHQDALDPMLQLMELFVRKGRRNIFFMGPSPRGDARFEAYSRIMEEYNLPLLTLQPDDVIKYTMRCGEDLTKKALTRIPNLDGIFAYDDQLAIGAICAIHRCGKKIPDDIAVAGFDNIEASEFTIPPLTTIELPSERFADAIFSEIMSSIEDINHNRKIMIPCRVIERESL